MSDPSATAQLVRRIQSDDATLGVVGLGYVGLPLVMTFAAKGLRVIGLDIDPRKVESLSRGESYIAHIDAARVQALVEGGRFHPTTDFSRIAECDAVLLCVPTPLGPNREPDMSYIVSTAETIGPHVQRGQLVVLESTTYPGTTDELLREVLERRSGLKAGEDFALAYSPEREDPGNPRYGTASIPKVVGGLTPGCREAAVTLYARALERVVPVSSTKVAEMTKLLENIFRSVNIALVNELKLLCERMGMDVWEVIDAAATKPFGYMPFYPGPGLGGHCIPIDPFYLTWKAREYELSTRFIELAGEINADMPGYVVRRTIEGLNRRRMALRGAKVLILGVAYKRDVDDVRESPALRVMELLSAGGAELSYHDPHVPRLGPTRRYDFDMASVELDDETLRSCDAAVIITDHSGVDYARVVRLAPLVIDTRNATRDVAEHTERILKA